MNGERKCVDKEDGFKQLVDLLDPNTHLEAVNVAVLMGGEFSMISRVEAMAAVTQSEAVRCLNS